VSGDTPSDDDPRTVFAPMPRDPGTRPGGAGNGTAVSRPGAGIRIGDVLNHIFAVKRFIARGGMGEVFEGANIITDERVAIKVMLPALAADPDVISLFHREARTLTHLHHEAVVQYRVLAQEPQLNVLYIVTEYIDGTNLSDALGSLHATPEELTALLRRLASGLRAAHALGAIHRDISPDNVLLGNGKLALAKIIDFGIAKDLDPGTATIVGDGFAGKLGYVAPEQLGDYGRRLGPWTDVYSLGLVILAVAAGRDIGMGGSLVDAVDKRRAGPDLSAAPAELRPVLDRMTRADPDERYASMDAVLAELDASLTQPLAAGTAAQRPAWLIPTLAAVALMIVVGLGLWVGAGRGPRGSDKASMTAAAVTGDPLEVARNAINAALPSVSCTWLHIVDVKRQGSGVRVGLTGVAGDPSAAQNEIGRALIAQKVEGANLDFSEVSPITPPGCAALDAYRQIRAPEGARLSVAQRQFGMRLQPPGSAYAGKIAAEAVVGIAIADPKLDFTLIGLEPSGIMTTIFANRADFSTQVAQSVKGVPISALGDDRYRMTLDLDHPGWSGLLLITGKGPFDPAVVKPDLGARGPSWRDRLVSSAADRGWQASMVWFKSVEEAGK
jgi:serine/threonine-protein kinase